MEFNGDYWPMTMGFTAEERRDCSAKTRVQTAEAVVCTYYMPVAHASKHDVYASNLREETPVAEQRGSLQMIQQLKGKKLGKYRAQLAEAVEIFIDADMGSGR